MATRKRRRATPDPVRAIQLQRDAWRELAEEAIRFMAEGLDERSGYSAVQTDVIAAWQRRVSILAKGEP